MAKAKDLYAILGVSKTASVDDIRKAYRALARRHHPDVNPGDAAAEERFKDATLAYDVLRDAEKRRLYDEFGMDGLQSGFDPQRARAYRRWADSGHGFSFGPGAGGVDFGFDLGRRGRRRRGGAGLGDIFGDVFGGFGGAEPEATAPRDLEHPIEVAFMDALRGTSMRVSIRRPTSCRACNGTGRRERRGCTECGGSGRTERSERLSVKLPAGIADGARVRVPGKGEETPDGRTGHLIFVVRVRPHPLLVREGRNLLMDVPITVGEAMRGGRITVPSPRGGQVAVTVAAGTQSGTRLRIPGHGAPDPKGGGSGDLIVRLLVHVPGGGDDGLGQALEALDAAYAGDVRAGLRL